MRNSMTLNNIFSGCHPCFRDHLCLHSEGLMWDEILIIPSTYQPTAWEQNWVWANEVLQGRVTNLSCSCIWIHLSPCCFIIFVTGYQGTLTLKPTSLLKYLHAVAADLNGFRLITQEYFINFSCCESFTSSNSMAECSIQSSLGVWMSEKYFVAIIRFGTSFYFINLEFYVSYTCLKTKCKLYSTSNVRQITIIRR